MVSRISKKYDKNTVDKGAKIGLMLYENKFHLDLKK